MAAASVRSNQALSTGSDADPLWNIPAGLDGDVEGATVEAGLVAGQVAFGIAALVVWVTVGVVTAVVVARRGHDLAPAAALGVLLGPLLAVYAASTVARRERETGPVIVDDGVESGGDVDVLVGVLGDGSDCAGALPVFSAVGDRLRRVTLAKPVSFETVGDPDQVTLVRRAEAVETLRNAAAGLPVVAPHLVLLPGRPARALIDYADEHGIDHIALIGGDAERAEVESAARACGHHIEPPALPRVP